MKNVEWVDYLALRASYGVQGNIGDNSSPDLIIQLQGRQDLTQLRYATLKQLPNPDLRWEKTKSVNVGLEFGLGGRFSATLEYYNKRSEDLLMNKEVSMATGRNYLTINSGIMENKGFEGAISVDIVKHNGLQWTFRANAAHNENKIIKSQYPEATEKEMGKI